MPRHQLCRNCGRTVDDNYCPACGQRTTTYRLSWATLLESFASTFVGDEAYGLRGMHMRKGLVGTWWAIVAHPARSIEEFIGGHRRKYFNPVAILLLLSTLYGIVGVWAGKQAHPTVDTSHPLLRQAVNAGIDYLTLHPAAAALMTLPFGALAMKTLFGRRSDLCYVEYFYIGIFLSVFEVTLVVFQLPLELLIPHYNSFYGNTLPVFLYTAWVYRRLFDLKKKGAAVRTLAVQALTYVYMAVAIAGCAALFVGGVYVCSPETFESFRRVDAQQSGAGREPTRGEALLEAFGGAISDAAETLFGEEADEGAATVGDAGADETGGNAGTNATADGNETADAADGDAADGDAADGDAADGDAGADRDARNQAQGQIIF